jgi:hypothetical protein
MEDKLTEFEERTRMIYENCVAYNKGAIGFIQELRQIMPPVCTETERKFLDKIKKDGEYDDDFGIQTINIYDETSNHDDMMCTFNSVVFSDINLKNLVQGE